MKLLRNPELCKNHSIYERIKSLSKKYVPINNVNCVVFQNEDDANHWIQLRHTGENDGVGIVKWDTQQSDRFAAKVSGKSAIALQAIEFLKKSKFVDDKLKEKASQIPSTNLDRLITDPTIQDVLGIKIRNNEIMTHIPEEEVAKGFSKIANDLVQKKIKVKDIYYKDNRRDYIENFSKENLPNKDKRTSEEWCLKDVGGNDKEITSSTKISTAQKRSISLKRNCLIPSDCIMPINKPRINAIYKELKKLDCDDFVNAVSVLLRVFLEFSIDSIIGAKGLKISTQAELRNKVKFVAEYFKKEKIMGEKELKGILVAADKHNDLLSINTFNAYIHNPHYSPISKDLKTTWDNIQLFISKIWENS